MPISRGAVFAADDRAGPVLRAKGTVPTLLRLASASSLRDPSDTAALRGQTHESADSSDEKCPSIFPPSLTAGIGTGPYPV